jgi:hypothetical protein
MTECSAIGKMFMKAMRDTYAAKISTDKATIEIYVQNPVAIGEHPQHAEEIDKLLDSISTNEDKLENFMDIV